MLVDTIEDDGGLRVLKIKQALVIIEAKVCLHLHPVTWKLSKFHRGTI